ncbi:phosphatase PAP2 family protein [Actinomycetaceae bacterium L2_0104]
MRFRRHERSTASGSFRIFLLAFLLALLSVPAYLVDGEISRFATRALSNPIVAGFIDASSDIGIVLLLLIFGGLATSLWTRERRWNWLPAMLGGAVVLAYLTSEVIKLIVEELRPCQKLDLPLVAACPPLGDWSWPSNHSVIAGALAAACVIIRRSVSLLVSSLAVIVGVGRVFAGEHYAHDVLAGLALGVLVVGAAWALYRTIAPHMGWGASALPGSDPDAGMNPGV